MMIKKAAQLCKLPLYCLRIGFIFISIFLSGHSRADDIYNWDRTNLFSHNFENTAYGHNTFISGNREVSLLRTVFINDNCAAMLSNGLSLNVPIIIFHGQPYWADFQAAPDSIEIQLTNYGLLIDTEPFISCRTSSLSSDLTLHIPTIVFNDIYYLADFGYNNDLTFNLIGIGQKNGNTSQYQLSSASTYQEGCVSPCMCPIAQYNKISGTFRLIRLNPTVLFEKFSLDDIRWAVIDSYGAVVHTITGFGIYQTGGEFARMHQLILEVSIDGNEQRRFDSGMVSDGTQFPVISIAVDRGTKCYDIFMDIEAIPSM